jgi:hypothetical protein
MGISGGQGFKDHPLAIHIQQLFAELNQGRRVPFLNLEVEALGPLPGHLSPGDPGVGHQGTFHLAGPDGQEAGARTHLGLFQHQAAGQTFGSLDLDIVDIFNAKQVTGQELMVKDHQTQANTGQGQ